MTPPKVYSEEEIERQIKGAEMILETFPEAKTALRINMMLKQLRKERDEARLTARSQNNLVAALKPEHATVFPWEAPKGGE